MCVKKRVGKIDFSAPRASRRRRRHHRAVRPSETCALYTVVGAGIDCEAAVSSRSGWRGRLFTRPYAGFYHMLAAAAAAVVANSRLFRFSLAASSAAVTAFVCRAAPTRVPSFLKTQRRRRVPPRTWGRGTCRVSCERNKIAYGAHITRSSGGCDDICLAAAAALQLSRASARVRGERRPPIQVFVCASARERRGCGISSHFALRSPALHLSLTGLVMCTRIIVAHAHSYVPGSRSPCRLVGAHATSCHHGNVIIISCIRAPMRHADTL